MCYFWSSYPLWDLFPQHRLYLEWTRLDFLFKHISAFQVSSKCILLTLFSCGKRKGTAETLKMYFYKKYGRVTQNWTIPLLKIRRVTYISCIYGKILYQLLKKKFKIPVTEQGRIWISQQEIVRTMMHPVLSPGYSTQGSQKHNSASTVLWPHATNPCTLLHSEWKNFSFMTTLGSQFQQEKGESILSSQPHEACWLYCILIWWRLWA